MNRNGGSIKTDSVDNCELPSYNPPSAEIKSILQKYKTVAMVGASKDPMRDSFVVMKYLKENGFRVIPVNPNADEILGEKVYPSLSAIPKDIKIEIVDIFRKPEFLAEVTDEAIKIEAKVIWMQLGLANNSAAEKARKLGIIVVMNKCIKVEYQRQFGMKKR